MKRPWWLPLAVVLLWLPTLTAPFTYDDRKEVVGNATIRDLSEWAAIATYNYARPILIATYALNWRIGGLDPVGYHAVGIAIHAVNAWLGWRLLSRLLSPERAVFGAALWALHPMTTEAVTYVTGRSDALVTLWSLIALIAWLDHARSPDRSRWLGAIAATVLAMLTKEVAAVLPLMLLAAELWCVAGGNLRLLRWRAYGPLAALLVVGLVVRLALYGWPAPEVPRGALTHAITEAEATLHYLRLWLAPWGQSIFHDLPARIGVLGIAGAVGLVGWGAWALRRRGLSAFGFAAFTLPLVVPAAFVLKETMAEHRAYASGLAVCAGLAIALPLRRWRWGLVVAAVGLTAWRNHAWGEETRLWKAAVDVNPSSAEAWYGYGDALRLAQRPAEAEQAYRSSLWLAADRPDTLVNLGIVRAQLGDAEDARKSWEAALKLKPGHCPALNNLAALEVRSGRTAAGLGGYHGTLQWCPDDPVALYNLGDLYFQGGRFDEASVYLERFLAVAPASPNAPGASQKLAAAGGAPVSVPR